MTAGATLSVREEDGSNIILDMCTVNMIIVVSVCEFKMPADTNNSSHLSLDSGKQQPYIMERSGTKHAAFHRQRMRF